jgi:hypothetical protein
MVNPCCGLSQEGIGLRYVSYGVYFLLSDLLVVQFFSISYLLLS